MSKRLGCLHISCALNRQHLPPDHPGITRRRPDPDRDDQRQHSRAENGHEQKRKEKHRKREERVEQTAENIIDGSAAKTGGKPQNERNRHAQRGRAKTDGQGLPCPFNNAGV
ncbi:hypothetical protein ACVWW5_008424 [Bradyrhizobium sp. LM3.4]